MAEGLLQGGIGALVALVAVFAGYKFGLGVWGADLSLAFDGMAPRFLPASLCAALVAGGMLVGSLRRPDRLPAGDGPPLTGVGAPD